jgi:hypothetical protein
LVLQRQRELIYGLCVCLASGLAGCTEVTPPSGSPKVEVIVDADEVTCGNCELVLDTLAVLHSSDLVSLTMSTQVVYLPSVGRYVAGPIGSAGQIAVFDSAGNFVRLLLNHGEGPGELSLVSILGPGTSDTVIVVGSSNRILRVSTTTGGSVEGRVEAMTPRAVLGLPNSQIVVNNDGISLPNVAVLDPQFRLLGAFGDRLGAEPTDLFSDSRGLTLKLAPSLGSRILVAPMRFRLRFQEWTPSGELVRTIERHADWFQEYGIRHLPGEAAADELVQPLPVLSGMWMQGMDTLWIVGLVGDSVGRALGREGPPPDPVSAGRGQPAQFPEVDWNDVFDGVIEVIDLRSGRVSSRLRTDIATGSVVGPFRIATLQQMPTGDVVFAILGVRHGRRY